MSKIYVLKLQKNKFYVGKTNNIERRYQEHLDGSGSTWTKKYKPIQIYKIHEASSPFDEDKYTKMYMNEFGIDNVRGGLYVQENLDEIQKYTLQKEIWGANNCCTRCGRNNHFVSNCFASIDVDNNEIIEYVDEEDSDVDDSESENSYDVYKSSRNSHSCYRCGREGHFASNCYAKYHISGKYIK
jgi:hypothetical protein